MNKLEMKTTDIVNENIKYIQDRFPNAIVETEKGFEVDFNTLKQEMSNIIADDTKEKYQLTWPGKKEAILLANSRTTKTLRPIKEKSVDFDNTENIYIEGDNLEALKILQESYLNKIKCIYIDPPYNTGNDFIYNDNFNKNTNEELEDSGQVDEEGNRLVTNTESNGRFHSDWLSMMYSRLKLARNLLTEDGVVFISIDDNELINLYKICSEIFGEKNILNIFTRVTKKSSNNGQFFSPSTDYVITCAKKIDKLEKFSVPLTKEQLNSYNKEDEKGKYKEIGLFMSSLKHGGSRYPIMCPDGSKVITPTTQPWRWNEETYKIGLNKNLIVFKKSKNSPLINLETGLNSEWNIYTKLYLKDRLEIGLLPKNFSDEYQNTLGSASVNKLKIPFDFSKPVEFIEYLIKLLTKNDDIILDFFSGSATTAHAVMQLNAEDSGKRKYIMVQVTEKCNENSEAYKDGFETICEIGEERIRRAGKKIKEETNANIDYGFRVYKIDSSNMKDVYYKPNDLEQSQLNLFETNVKDDRTNEDLLTQIILDLGLTLDLKIEEKNILSNKVYHVAENSLVACFDKNIDINIIDEICKSKPLKIVFKEECFNTDNLKINVQEKIKKLSPESEVYVL